MGPKLVNLLDLLKSDLDENGKAFKVTSSRELSQFERNRPESLVHISKKPIEFDGVHSEIVFIRDRTNELKLDQDR